MKMICYVEMEKYWHKKEKNVVCNGYCHNIKEKSIVQIRRQMMIFALSMSSLPASAMVFVKSFAVFVEIVQLYNCIIHRRGHSVSSGRIRRACLWAQFFW